MAMTMPPILLLNVACLSLLVLPGRGTLCPRGEDDHISLCAMCSDKHAALRWNRSDSVTWRQMRVEYTCEDPQISTAEVLSSDQDLCYDAYDQRFLDLFTGVATIGAEITTGVRCDFTVVYRVTGGTYKANTNCTIRSTETCETSPEECHLDQICSVHEDGNCLECDCTPGYRGEECTNIDECTEGVDSCVQNAECADNEGSYTCVCSTGYTGDGFTSCTNINECESNSTCHDQADCDDTEGSYFCECRIGYEGDGYNHCIDIDECETNNTCPEAANCSNTNGSYVCVCWTGYREVPSENGFICSDINECESGDNTCHEHAQCTNSDGSFSCECLEGYTGDGYSTCADIDECGLIESLCHEDAQCTNTEGGYLCECRTGYEGDGYNCTDINECESGDNTCHEHAQCTNSDGSFGCECMEGYTGDGYNACADIDECGLIKSPCHEDAQCSNTEGSYECECRIGYHGDGYHCKDIDECGANYTCPEASNCTNTKGSYECVCWTGYQQVLDKNGSHCLDLLPHSTNIPAVVSGVVTGALLLVLLLVLLAFLCLRSTPIRLDKLPLDEMTAKNLDPFYTPRFSGWKGSLTSIHSEYERLQCTNPLTLTMEQGSTEQLSSPDTSSTASTSPPSMASMSSSKQEASGSSGHTTVLSQISDYQVDGAVSKQPEQEQPSTPAIDTISDIIAATEEEAHQTVVEQILLEAYASESDTFTSIISSSTSTTSQLSNETEPVQLQGINSLPPHTWFGISSSDTYPENSLSESPLEDWFIPQHMTNGDDIHDSKVSDQDYSSHELETGLVVIPCSVTEDIAQEWYGNSSLQSEEDIPIHTSAEDYCHTSAEQLISLNGYVHQHAEGVDFSSRRNIEWAT